MALRTNPGQARVKDAGDPKVALYAYQRAWIGDESRFKLAVKARQIGWTFATTLRHVRRRLSQRGLTVWISASKRQSKEAIEYVTTHLSALKQAFEAQEIEFPGTDETGEQVTLKHNGARILAMPANPKTVRGFSGDVVLDEFGFHLDPAAIWRGAMAIASRGHQVEVISTPNGQQGKYWDLCRAAGVPALGESERATWREGQWSIHWCDIEAAVKQGCPIDPKQMREAAGDEDTWLQEYCCVFLADAENYIPMELVVANESEQASLEMSFLLRGDCYMGVDIGRKKDRTVIWLVEKLGDVAWTRKVEVLERTPFQAQFALIDSLMPLMRRAAIDATGLGMQLAEDLQRKWGSLVEPVTFNLENKEKMATLTKRAFEERKVRIPAAAFLRRSINAVKRYTSPTGHFRFDAERTDKGHADEFWALALALSAASGPAVSTEFVASSAVQAHAASAAYM
jgi:phage FluMu gp28-like protein